MSDKQFTFLCNDDALGDAQAKDMIVADKALTLVDAFSKTFLVKAPQSAADCFAAAHALWQVSPVVLVPLPTTRLRPKPPTQG